MKIFLIAGEPSGDRLGAALMAGLKQLVPEVSFDGVGGPLMQGQSLQSRFAMDELSVFGIAEVLPKYRHLKRRIAQTARAVIDTAPDVLITIDSPDFCLRVARLVRESSRIRIVHYVAPSVWAWRPGRAAKMARHVDQVLALLPFEPPLMQAAGMRCDFVGHPVVTEPVADADAIAAFREEQGLGDARVLLVLPGSRRGEVARLGPVFGATVQQVLKRHGDLRVVVPAAAPVAGTVRQMTEGWPGKPIVLDPADLGQDAAILRKRCAFGAADLALAASGTVSLELAASDTPMVIAYDMNWLSWQIMSRMLQTDTVTLVNLVSDTRAVPEFLGPACRAEAISIALCDLLENAGHQQAQRAAMQSTMHALGRGKEAPGLRAARAVLDGMDRPAV